VTRVSHVHRRLAALRIPSGWTVMFNNLVEIDEVEALTDPERRAYLSQDLLSIHTARGEPRITLDVGWYPDEDPSGTYRLVLLRDSWDDILARLESRRHAVITRGIDLCLEMVNEGLEGISIQRRLDRLENP